MKTRRAAWTGCIIACAGMTVSLTHAAESNAVCFLPDVVVMGSKEAAWQLPASGAFLDTLDIRFHSYDNAHQVLRKTPGVYFQEETGYGLLPNISLRGVDTHRSQKITLMEDGVLTAPAPYSAPSAYYSPTMGRMSGIEVLKGSSQVKYGPHTTGGAINYLSTPVPDKPTAYFKSLYGTEDEFRLHVYGGGMRNMERGKIGGLAEIYHRQTDGFKTIRHFTGSDDETGFEKTDYMGKLAWELGDDLKQRLELKLGYTDLDADETYLGLSESDFDRDPFQRYFSSRFDHFSSEHFRSYLNHCIHLNEDLHLFSMVYYNSFERNWYKLNDIQNVDGLPPGSINLATALAAGGPALATLRGENAGIWRIRANNREYDLGGIQSVLKSDFDTGDTMHALEAGLRYHIDEAERFQWQDEYSVDDTGAVVDIARGPKGGAGDRTQEARALAGYIRDEISFGAFTLTPGIRAEYIDNEVKDRNAGTGTQTGHEEAVGGGLSARYMLSEQCFLFGGVHRGFSVPSPNDSINKDLKEETSIATEFGARYEQRGMGGEASLFYTEFDDLIVGSYVGTENDTDAENAGNVDSYGAEFKGEVDPGVLNDWGFKTPIWAAATYTHARLDGDAKSKDPGSIFSGGLDGNEVPYIPEFQVAVGCGLSFRKIFFEIIGAYMDSTYSTANNSSDHINPVTGSPDARFGKIDSRFVVDLTLRYELQEHLALFLNAHNLFDEEYLASRHPYGPRPGKPRLVMAGLEARF